MANRSALSDECNQNAEDKQRYGYPGEFARKDSVMRLVPLTVVSGGEEETPPRLASALSRLGDERETDALAQYR